MKFTIHLILIISVLFSVASYGSEDTEDDKYPEMAVFPKIDNPNVKITEMSDFNYVHK